MTEPEPSAPEGRPLNERIWDVLVFVPAGMFVSAVEELPRLAAKGREHLGVRVGSARAVGRYAVGAGRKELRRRSGGLLGGTPGPSPSPRRSAAPGPSRVAGQAGTGRGPRSEGGPSAGNGHVPAVATLAIPGFDTLSASQVVQRLDGLNRAELVSVRAYEASTRGRRTVLSRVDQLLDERS